jgi:hypothetical protein
MMDEDVAWQVAVNPDSAPDMASENPIDSPRIPPPIAVLRVLAGRMRDGEGKLGHPARVCSWDD